MTSQKFARYTPLEAIEAATSMAAMLDDQLDYAANTEETDEGAAEAAATLWRTAHDLADLLDAARRWSR